jgi:hypothetical protein
MGNDLVKGIAAVAVAACPAKSPQGELVERFAGAYGRISTLSVYFTVSWDCDITVM